MPAAAPQAAANAALPVELAEYNWQAHSVLVVDDEEGMRNFLERTLARRCGMVQSAADAERELAQRFRAEEDLEAARQLVVERRRPGGQSQFSPLLDLQRPDGKGAPEWVDQPCIEKIGAVAQPPRQPAVDHTLLAGRQRDARNFQNQRPHTCKVFFIEFKFTLGIVIALQTKVHRGSGLLCVRNSIGAGSGSGKFEFQWGTIHLGPLSLGGFTQLGGWPDTNEFYTLLCSDNMIERMQGLKARKGVISRFDSAQNKKAKQQAYKQ